jgi:hypothetical protein
MAARKLPTAMGPTSKTPDSITRAKSAIIFSLMIDGSGSLRFQEVRARNEFKKRPK